jgi:hypothetical protein
MTRENSSVMQPPYSPTQANPGLEWGTREKTKAAGGARGWWDLISGF